MTSQFTYIWLTCLTLLLMLPNMVSAHGGEVDRISYVALGDSIAGGAAATDDYGYVYKLRDGLASILGEVRLLNVAHGGFSTSDVRAQLTSDQSVRSALRSADLITLSIGGNHLMFCSHENFALLDEECVAVGIQAFVSDWDTLLDQLRAGDIGASGTLLVTTLYNPYPGDDQNFAAVETAIQRINDLIRDPVRRASFDYGVVEAHDRFLGRADDGNWRVCRWLRFCEATRDPHPNNAGHDEIASLHLREYLVRRS